MKKLFSFLFVVVLAGLLAISASAQTTYQWNVSNATGDYQIAANWFPTRTTPAATDILLVNGAVTTGSLVISNVATEDIAELHIISSAKVILEASSAAKTITIAGGASSADLEVSAGSSLRLRGVIGITIDLAATANGVINGDVIFNAGAASILHRIRSGQVDGLVFEDGSTAAIAPVSTGAQNGFGGTTGTANGVRFKSGSICYQGGEKNGTRNGGTGTNPFGLGQPASLVVFDSGANYITWDAIPASSGRTYGGFEWRNSAAQTFGGGSPFTVQNNFIVGPSGVVAQGNMNATGQTGNFIVKGNFTIQTGGPVFNYTPAPTTACNLELRGNVDVQDPALFTAPTDTDITVLHDGLTSKTINWAGETLPNMNINTTAGISLAANVTISGTLTLTTGTLTTNGNIITATNVSRPANGGYVNSALTRTINATVTGSRLFPIGSGAYSPVEVDITTAGTGTGTIAASVSSIKHPDAVDPAMSITRYWTISPAVISGVTSTLVFHYQQADITGSIDESNMVAASWNGVAWTTYPGTVIDTVNNTATVTGVTSFSDWTLIDPGTTSVKDWRQIPK